MRATEAVGFLAAEIQLAWLQAEPKHGDSHDGDDPHQLLNAREKAIGRLLPVANNPGSLLTAEPIEGGPAADDCRAPIARDQAATNVMRPLREAPPAHAKS